MPASSYAARRIRAWRRRISIRLPLVAASTGEAIESGASNDGMWRSIWAWTQDLHEHSGIDTPVWEQTVIRVP